MKSMKTIKMITIACWLLTGLVIIGLAAWFVTNVVNGERTGR